jgi:BASS family bile acid:Na+ symporter
VKLAQDVLVGLFVISLMWSVGLDLTIRSIREVFRTPRGLLGGLAAGYLVVPLAAASLVVALDLPAPVAAGLLLCAAAPGGPMGPLLVKMAGASLALSVSLLMTVNFINVLATPATLGLLGASPGGGLFSELLGMAGTIVAFQVVPLSVGILISERDRALADRLSPWARRFATVMLIGAVVVVSIWGDAKLEVLGVEALIAVLGVLVAAFVGGWMLAGGDRPDRAGVALSNTIRSQSLSVLLASTRFDDPLTLLIVLLFSAVMFPFGITMAALSRRMIGATPEDADADRTV